MKLIAPLFLMFGLTLCHKAFAQSPFVWQAWVGDSESIDAAVSTSRVVQTFTVGSHHAVQIVCKVARVYSGGIACCHRDYSGLGRLNIAGAEQSAGFGPDDSVRQ